MKKHFKQSFVVIALSLTMILGIALLFHAPMAHALSSSDWSAGRIIDDTIFFNPNLLGNDTNIQQFLNSKVPACDTNGSKPYGSTTRAAYGTANNNPPPYTCLRDYSQSTPNEPAEAGLCNAYSGGTKSAAKIIYDVAQACGINPGVLLVVLQKEQGLITDDWPWQADYQKATGFGCPDTAGCDSTYYGFFNQVYHSARQYRYYKLHPDYFNYRAGRYNYIAYKPNSSCGPPNDGQHNVFIQNDATAGLYDYTPYQPNDAALNNMTGLGDGCSSYGNRNFWQYFNTWFGSTATSARVIVTRYNTTTDKTGEAARIGLSLNQQPNYPVTIPVELSDNSVAGFVSPTRITISPQNWNRPDLNQVVVYGKNNGTVGSQYYRLITDSPSTADGQFRLLTGEFVEDVTLTNFDDTTSPVYRLYSQSTGFHTYTANVTEKNNLVSQGYSDEGVAFYYCKSGDLAVDRLLQQSGKPFLAVEGTSEIAAAQQSGFQLDVPDFTISRSATIPVYRLYNATTKDHLYTIDPAERDYVASNYGYTVEGIAFNTCSQNKDPVYRMYNPSNNDHFYTTSPAERDAAGGSGYNFEGIGFYIDHTPVSNVQSVYRLVNSRGLHFYTTSPAERDAAIAGGYRYEGIGFSIGANNSSSNLQVYRLLNRITGAHLYTVSDMEKTSVGSAGFSYEGVGFLVSF